jgi:molecular chaperone GrpE
MRNSNKQGEMNSGASEADLEQSDRKRLEEELRHEREMHLRALADFENYRRRIERDQASAAKGGKRDIILSLLDVLDGFDHALEHVDDMPSGVLEGFQTIHRKLIAALGAQDVVPLTSVGEPFNPEMHEAVGSVQSDRYPSGAVVDEVRRGYRWGGDLLRPARVRVAN